MTGNNIRHGPTPPPFVFPTRGRTEVPRGTYLCYLGMRKGYPIWIVSGKKVQGRLDPEFIMGGNPGRYAYEPKPDIWIENGIGVRELEFTIAHEVIEYNKMLEGLTYNEAHVVGGLELETKMRRRNRLRIKRKAKECGDERIPSLDAPLFGEEEILRASVYMNYLGKRRGKEVWVVDGGRIREFVHRDFFGGSHYGRKAYVPENEIWIDSDISCEYLHYVLLVLTTELRWLGKSFEWGKAYDAGQAMNLKEIRRQERICREHERKLPRVSFGRKQKCTE